ncbi:MAG: TonB-dependent receptor [Dokdonia sp.]|jgi:hemoglobin/transferrin/lactoferrin receptor protein
MRLLPTLLFLCSFTLFGQKVTVLDVDTREPIVGVALFNKDTSKSTVTNFDGVADISAFAKAETIYFSELAHKDASYTKAQLATFKYTVFLKQKENMLGEIILSASKFAQSRRNVPQKVIGLTPENITFANPQTSADLLESSGQVFVQKSQLGGGSPLIRGFSTNRLLITLDGVRFNTAIFRGGNVQNVLSIDPLGLDRTEVILGPGSVVYGSDAVGGVMNFYTKKPQLSGDQEAIVSGMALSRFSTANTEKTAHFDINFRKRQWSFLTSASYSDYGDQRMGRFGPDDYLRPEFVTQIGNEDVVVQNENPRKQVSTGFSAYHLMQKVRFVPNAFWDFNFNVLYSNTSDYDRYDRLTQRDDQGQLRSAEWFYGPQEWLMTNFQANHEGSGSLFDRMQTTLAYQYFKESRNDRRFGRDQLRTRTERVNALSAAIDFTKNVGTKRNKIFYGAEYVFNHVNSNGRLTNIFDQSFAPTDTRYPDGSNWSSAAVYASGQFSVDEELNLITGLRYNHIYTYTNFRGNNAFFEFPFEEARSDFGNLTGSIGINYTASRMIQLKANLSTAFRAPNIDDIGKVFDSGDGNLVVPNPDLKAEYAYNADAGLTVHLDNKFTFDGAVFYTLLNNALVRRDYTLNGEDSILYQDEPTNIQAIQNAGNARIHGVELGVSWKFLNYWELTSQLNITKGVQEEDDGSEAPVRHVAPTFGNAHILFQKGKWKLDAFAEYNGQLDANELAPSEAQKPWIYALDQNGNPFSPDWYTLNLTTQYRITPKWTATVNLDNITDQRYRTYSSGIAAPGRNLIMALQYQF